jgi:hypothetical protein
MMQRVINRMRTTLELSSYLSLAVIVLVPVLFYLGKVDLAMNKTLLNVVTVAWFASALCWMGRKKQ